MHSLAPVPVPLAVFEKGLRSCLRSTKRIAIQELAFLECVPLIHWESPPRVFQKHLKDSKSFWKFNGDFCNKWDICNNLETASAENNNQVSIGEQTFYIYSTRPKV